VPRTTVLAPLLLGILLAAPAVAEGKALPLVTARQLAAWCDADGAPEQSLCAGYVLGVSDVLAADLPVHGRRACFPVGVRSGSLIQAVRAFLAEHPRRGFERATEITAEALAKAYPCS